MFTISQVFFGIIFRQIIDTSLARYFYVIFQCHFEKWCKNGSLDVVERKNGSFLQDIIVGYYELMIRNIFTKKKSSCIDFSSLRFFIFVWKSDENHKLFFCLLLPYKVNFKAAMMRKLIYFLIKRDKQISLFI